MLFRRGSVAVRKHWVREWKWAKGDDGRILGEDGAKPEAPQMTAISVCEEPRKKETGEEKQRVKDHRSNVQRGIFLHHWGLSEGAHHAWLTQANRAAKETATFAGLIWSWPTHGGTHTVCLLALLFRRGQLCDSRRWHLPRKKTSRRVMTNYTAPVSPLSVITITTQGRSCVVGWSPHLKLISSAAFYWCFSSKT